MQRGGNLEVQENAVSGPIRWLTENPGRQLLTGSFHPVTDENWDKEAYIAQSQQGLQPISSSAFSGDFDQLRSELSNNSVNVNSLDPGTGKCPLALACIQGNVECVKLLLSHGADPNCVDSKYDLTPLHFAQLNDPKISSDLTSVLIQHQAKVDAKNRNLLTPLHLACYFGNIDSIKQLLAASASVESLDALGRAPLHLYVLGDCDQLDDLSILTSNNITLSYTAPSGNLFPKSPLALAAAKKCNKFLRRYGHKQVTGQRTEKNQKYPVVNRTL